MHPKKSNTKKNLWVSITHLQGFRKVFGNQLRAKGLPRNLVGQLGGGCSSRGWVLLLVPRVGSVLAEAAARCRFNTQGARKSGKCWNFDNSSVFGFFILILCKQALDYFILYPQLEATVHLQEIDNNIQGSIFMSVARVYHIKIESDDLDECGANMTKCWTGTVDLAKIRNTVCPFTTLLKKTKMNKFLGLFATFLT